MTDYLSSKALDHLKQLIMSHADECFIESSIEVSITGTTVLWAGMDEHISKTQLRSIIIAFIFMTFFLPLIFKSIPLGITGLIINFTPISIALGVMAFCGIRINIATAIIGSISIGVVVDDTIHLLMRYRQELQSGVDVDTALQRTLLAIGPVLTATTLILMAGFGAMMVSSTEVIVLMGMLSCVALLTALIADLVILPSLIVLLHGKRARRSASTKLEDIQSATGDSG